MPSYNQHREGTPSDDSEKYKLAQEFAREFFGQPVDAKRDYFHELEEFCFSRKFKISVSYSQGSKLKECTITISFPELGLPPVSHTERDKNPVVAKNRAAQEPCNQLEKDLHS